MSHAMEPNRAKPDLPGDNADRLGLLSRRAFLGAGAAASYGLLATLGAGAVPAAATTTTDGTRRALAGVGGAPDPGGPSSVPDWINVKSFGAQGETFPAAKGAIAANSKTLKLSSASGLTASQFTSNLFRPGIEVAGAGPLSGGRATSLLASVVGVDATGKVLTLDATASTSVNGAALFWNDAAPIQAALDWAIDPSGTRPPSSSVRVPTAPVYIPAGSYRLAHGLRVQSVRGLQVIGDGNGQSALYLAMPYSLDSLLELDGVSNSVFEGLSFGAQNNFSAPGYAGSAYADKVVYLHWSKAAAGSTTFVTFRDVVVGEAVGAPTDGSFRSGFAVGTDGNTPQVDGCCWDRCKVRGLWMNRAEARRFQNGWEIGAPGGSTGNNLDHTLIGCEWYQVRYGLTITGVPVWVFGGQSSFTETDVVLLSNNSPVVIDGFRSELAARLLRHEGGGADSHVTIRNVQYAAANLGYGPNGPPPAGPVYWITSGVGTSLVLEQVFCWDPPSGVEPAIYVSTQSFPAYPSLYASVTATGVASNSTIDQAFVSPGDVVFTIQNYHQLDANLVTVAVTPLRVRRIDRQSGTKDLIDLGTF